MNEIARLVAISQFDIPTDTLLSLLPVGVYACDADGRITLYNQAAAELWGRTPAPGDDEQRFCGALRLYRGDGSSLPHDMTPMATALRTGEGVRDQQVVIERDDGSRVWVAVNIDALRGSDGSIIGAVNCFQDITARKEAEHALRRSEAFLGAVFDATPECIKIVERDGSLRQMNSAGLRAIEADDFAGVAGACVFDLIAPEHREDWCKRHERVCDGASLSWNFDVIGLKGTRRRMETHAVPFELEGGEGAQLAITRDVTERIGAQEELQANRRWLADLLQALPVAVYTTDAQGRITLFNKAAEDLWGRTPQLGELWCGSYKLIYEDGTPMPHDECPMAIALKENRPVHDREAVLERPDGSHVPFKPYPTPLRDEDGGLVGAVNMMVDITHHKEARDRQETLIHELNHRVKNTLAVVTSIARLSRRSSAGLDEFIGSFEGRLEALSRTHNLLNVAWWESVGFKALLDTEIAPYVSTGAVELEGEDALLSPKQGIALSLIFHELATNAVKYGALSARAGRLRISWQPISRSGQTWLEVTWNESRGPRVVPPTKKGFGTMLLARSVEGDLGGRIEEQFESEGYRCKIEFPLAS